MRRRAPVLDRELRLAGTAERANTDSHGLRQLRPRRSDPWLCDRSSRLLVLFARPRRMRGSDYHSGSWGPGAREPVAEVFSIDINRCAGHAPS
jgi:hypothetical protein